MGFIQLLCRIGIRLHDGRQYSVYYSTDFVDSFICSLKDYLENKDLTPLQVQSTTIPDWLEDLFDKSNVRSNFREQIMDLCRWNESILYALQRGENYSPHISLNDLYEIIPKDRKKKERYGTLVKVLRKLGIRLEII